MTISFSENTATISSAEFSLVSASTTLSASTTTCILQVFIDLSNMAAGDGYEIKVKEKVKSGGTQRIVYDSGPLFGAQPGPFVSPSLIVGDGWDVTVTKTAGTDRAFDWSLRQVS